MTFGGTGFWKVVGTLGASTVDRIVGSALDAGVYFIDTANVYSAEPREADLIAQRAFSIMYDQPGTIMPGVAELPVIS